MNKKILVPLDGSELAECTLNHVKSMIKDGTVCEVTLLNVVNIDVTWAKIGYSSYNESINKIREEIFLSAKQYLTDLESKLASEGIAVKTEVLKAIKPARAITDYAHRSKMDMIVIATHGYTGMKKMMLGSVAFEVLHQSHVPVLLIRPEFCQV